jgi:hypothetical protein
VWDFETDTALVDGRACNADGVFVRHDVFAGLQDPRPEHAMRAYAWFQAVHGWALAHNGVRLFNAHATGHSGNKAAMLSAAVEAGLQVPSTVITNLESGVLHDRFERAIAKPIGGGDHCYPLEVVMSRTTFRDGAGACPAIVQQRLEQPEVRIYIVGAHDFSFELASESLDYRLKQDVEIIVLPDPPAVLPALRRLMQAVGMDFGAADFKTDPATGELVFLELNSSPMFARCDLEIDGAISRAIVHELTGEEHRARAPA